MDGGETRRRQPDGSLSSLLRSSSGPARRRTGIPARRRSPAPASAALGAHPPRLLAGPREAAMTVLRRRLVSLLVHHGHLVLEDEVAAEPAGHSYQKSGEGREGQASGKDG